TGFSGTDVQLIFMGQAVIIGVAGGVLGLLTGFVLSKIIDRTPFETEALPTITTYPVDYDPTSYFIGITFALLSTFVAGYLPSNRANNIDPVLIIRGTSSHVYGLCIGNGEYQQILLEAQGVPCAQEHILWSAERR